jgi:periplasmic divalent cation tolerance protein
MFARTPELLVGWTTTETAAQARQLAEALIAEGLAVCVQIDGPIHSHYQWEGKNGWSEEHRIWVKLLPDKQIDIEGYLHTRHPYQVPQWVVVPAHAVGGKYLSWARATRTN